MIRNIKMSYINELAQIKGTPHKECLLCQPIGYITRFISERSKLSSAKNLVSDNTVCFRKLTDTT